MISFAQTQPDIHLINRGDASGHIFCPRPSPPASRRLSCAIHIALATVAGLLGGCQDRTQPALPYVLPSPLSDCGKIKLSGTLAINVAALPEPPQCGRVDRSTPYEATQLAAYRRIGGGRVVPAPDDPAQPIILHVRLMDKSYSLDELPVHPYEAHFMDFNPIDPAIRTELSSADTRVYSVEREDRVTDNITWVCIFAHKVNAAGQTLDIDICRPIAFHAPSQIAETTARLIGRNDLPLISAVP